MTVNAITAPKQSTEPVNRIGESMQKLQENKSNFLKLFTTQMKNQNPLSPMDAGSMYNNIAQLNTLEQHLESNKILEDMYKLVQSQSVNAAYSATIMGDISATLNDISGAIGVDKESPSISKKSFGYTIPPISISKALLVIKNEYGMPIFEKEVKATPGHHIFSWDGIDYNGNKLEDTTPFEYDVTLWNDDGRIIGPAKTDADSTNTTIEQRIRSHIRNLPSSIDELV